MHLYASCRPSGTPHTVLTVWEPPPSVWRRAHIRPARCASIRHRRRRLRRDELVSAWGFPGQSNVGGAGLSQYFTRKLRRRRDMPMIVIGHVAFRKTRMPIFEDHQGEKDADNGHTWEIRKYESGERVSVIVPFAKRPRRRLCLPISPPHSPLQTVYQNEDHQRTATLLRMSMPFLIVVVNPAKRQEE